MGKPSTIDTYFKRKTNEAPQASDSSTLPSVTQIADPEQQFKVEEEEKEVDISLLEKDPGKRCSIWQYPVDLFIATLDTQLQELNSRFCDNMVELLTLSSALDPKDLYKSLDVEKICELAIKFYPGDFTEQEKMRLRIQAQHYKLDVPFHAELKNLSTISELCQGLVKTGKYLTYPLIDRLIRLVLTLPVSNATTERSFSAMKIVKNRLRNKMEDGFLADCLISYIERRIAEKFDTDSIIDEFYDIE